MVCAIGFFCVNSWLGVIGVIGRIGNLCLSLIAFSKLPKLPKFSLLCPLLALFLPYLRAKGVVGKKGNFLFIFDMFTHLSVIFCLHTPALLFFSLTISF